MSRFHLTIFPISIILTAVMSVIAWFLSGQPPLVGIDDAAITRSYSENIANGYGFVYNIGGERVEGATSFLWTLIVSLAYLLPFKVEFTIIAINYVVTVCGVTFSLWTAASIARHFSISRKGLTGLLIAIYISMPGYFMWSVVSMMEIAIWSAAISFLVWRIVRHLDATPPARWLDGGLLFGAMVLPLIRPEGVAIAVGLLALTLIIAPRRSLPPLIAICAAMGSLAALVLFRLSYFGYPFPNTYYAKVSSDRVQDIIDGLKYLVRFLNQQPFADFFVLCWAGLAVLAIANLIRKSRTNTAGLLIVAATVFGMLSIYAVLGGDHFAQWRFYQPLLPLFAIGPALLVLLGFDLIRPYLASSFATFAALSASFLMLLGCSWLPFYQARFEVQVEYILTYRGEEFGDYLNTVTPLPRLGVVAAGGIALSYKGWLLDLMGLNWTRMAHANPVKVGYRNHASFDKGVFWDETPDLIANFTSGICQKTGWIEPNAAEGPLKGLIADTDFQKSFSPVRLWADDENCWNGFANREWLAILNDSRIERVPWSALVLHSY